MYYKLRYPRFYKKYTEGKFLFFSTLGDEFFYSKQIYSYSIILPILFLSLVLSLVFISTVNNIYLDNYLGIYLFSEFINWLMITVVLFFYFYLRISLFFVLGILLRLPYKLIKVLAHDFLKITIYCSVLNLAISYLILLIIDFESVKLIFEIISIIMIVYRVYYLYRKAKQLSTINNIKLIIYLLFVDFLISIFTIDFLTNSDFRI